MNGYNLRVIEERSMMSIMLFLLKNGSSRKMDVYENVSKSPRMAEKLDILQDNGLIVMRKGPPTMVELTPTGLTISQHLSEIEDLLRTEKVQEP